MKGVLMIVSGPSGVGKDTVLNRWFERDPNVKRVVSCTTRQPREGEVNGVDYHFLSPADFEGMVLDDQFLEHKNVHGNYYGTPLKQVEEMLAAGIVAILKIDVQGALTVTEKRPETTSVFLLPPSWEELERRLTSRGTEDAEALAKRLKNAKDELATAPKYQHQVVNDDIDKAVDELARIAEEARK